jgi:hypothetical protein
MALGITWSPNGTATTTESIATYAFGIEALNHPLPWTISNHEVGAIYDAKGKVVGVVDVGRNLSNNDALLLAFGIVKAVNVCAGYTLDKLEEECLP